MPQVIKNNSLQEAGDDEVDFEIEHPTSLYGSHINLIPLQSSVASPREFYGARFFNQAMPLEKAEAPLVQNMALEDDQGRSYDDLAGSFAGALRSDGDADVVEVTPDHIVLNTAEGQVRKPLYRNFAFNRKSGISHRPLVKPGDRVTKDQLLAASNFTDDNGTLAMGMNARVGLVPYKGFSMDDAVVISEGFAKRLKSEHIETHLQEYDDHVSGGLNHFKSLFPDKFTKDQLGHLDEHGVVKEGTILQPGDPMMLVTRPRMVSSTAAQLGRLSNVMRTARTDASQIWEGKVPAEVTDVIHNKDGVKVVTKAYKPAEPGDKIVLRSGQKGTVSLILPDDRMLQTSDGMPMDVLLNPLGIPSRQNDSLPYELLLGRVARKQGKPLKLPSYPQPGTAWYDFVEGMLKEAGIPDKEQVYDPQENKWLENPITIGDGYVMKLHHTAESKSGSRSQGGYDLWEQPQRGGNAGGGAKRLSGLEVGSLMSSGAYATIREGATLRGQRNDEFWRRLRAGQDARPVNRPFAWDKFRAMLTGAGLRTKEHPDGVLRLGPVTDRDIDDFKPMEVKNGQMVDLNTFEPKPGGLFDTGLVGGNRWGYVQMPFKIPNPAFEDAIRHLLGLKRTELQDILAGRMELPKHLR